MKQKLILVILIGIAVFSAQQCTDDSSAISTEPSPQATPYIFEVPQGFPQPYLSDENPLTVEGIELGRHLFYEKRLSRDGTLSCAGCHLQLRAFGDETPTSDGVDGIFGRRKAMPLFNLAWQEHFFWDGRASSLEEQALMPIVDPIEMDNTLEKAMNAIKDDTLYQRLFLEAFGSNEVTEEGMAMAIAQFERTIVSANSKYDRVVRLNTGETFTPDEEAGFSMFLSEDGDCFHCHGPAETGHLFGAFGADLQFKNNGNKADYSADEGLAEISGRTGDIGKFKVPSVRNAQFISDYMHDGSIPNLDSLIEFYNFGGFKHFNVDPNMKAAGIGRQWSPAQKEQLGAFIRTLTDFEFLQDSAFADPFLSN